MVAVKVKVYVLQSAKFARGSITFKVFQTSGWRGNLRPVRILILMVWPVALFPSDLVVIWLLIKLLLRLFVIYVPSLLVAELVPSPSTILLPKVCGVIGTFAAGVTVKLQSRC